MNTQRKDYRVDVRIRNNNLLRAIRKHGFTSIPTFAAEIGVSYPQLNNLIAMRISPLKKNGNLLPITEKLIVALNLPFDELFNEQQREGLETNRKSVELTAEGMFALTHISDTHQLSPSDGAENEQMRTVVRDVLFNDPIFTERERDVIAKRFGFDGPPMTLDELAEEYGLSREAIRSSEQKALRKLRNPFRAEKLSALLDERVCEMRRHPLFLSVQN